jgi:hypothetical protein
VFVGAAAGELEGASAGEPASSGVDVAKAAVVVGVWVGSGASAAVVAVAVGNCAPSAGGAGGLGLLQPVFTMRMITTMSILKIIGLSYIFNSTVP